MVTRGTHDSETKFFMSDSRDCNYELCCFCGGVTSHRGVMRYQKLAVSAIKVEE